MKKFGMMALVIGLVAALALPATASELKVSGEFRSQWWLLEDMNGVDEDTGDYNYLRSRARIKANFIANDNAQFVTQFELGDDEWGDDDWLDIGTDGTGEIEVRHAYMDVTLGSANLKAGAQPYELARKWLLDTDAAGLTLTLTPSDTISLPIIWVKAFDEGTAAGMNNKTSDVDYYAIAPVISVSEGITVSPYFMWVTSDHMDASDYYTGVAADTNGDYDAYYLGVDVDAAFGPIDVFFTGIMESGTFSMDEDTDDDDYTLSGYVVNLGGSYTMDTFDVSAEFRLSTGDDFDTNDEYEGFSVIEGSGAKSWSFILGDEDIGHGAGNVGDTNLVVASVGCGVKPTDKVSLNADVYYAIQAHHWSDESEDYGVEVNLDAGFKLVDNVSLNLLAAYLFAGEAYTGGEVENEANPYEMGASLKIKF